MCSAYKLNKQSDNIQFWHTPFPIWNQSIVPCPFLTVASWPACRFLKREVRWSCIPISLRIFHSSMIEPLSRQPRLENTYIKEVLTLLWKFYDPWEISPTGDPPKGLRTPREFNFGSQWDLITDIPQEWENRFLEGTNKSLSTPGSRQEKGAVIPQETKPELPVSVHEFLAVMSWQCLSRGQGPWIQQCWHKSFWRRSPLLP